MGLGTHTTTSSRRRFLRSVSGIGLMASASGIAAVATDAGASHLSRMAVAPRQYAEPNGRDIPEHALDIYGQPVRLRPEAGAPLIMLFVHPPCGRCMALVEDARADIETEQHVSQLVVAGVQSEPSADETWASMLHSVRGAAYLPSAQLAEPLQVMMAPWAGLVNAAGQLLGASILAEARQLRTLARGSGAVASEYLGLPFTEANSHIHAFQAAVLGTVG